MGGLAGSKQQGKSTNQQVQHCSDVTVTGNLRLESDKGVTISGSRVVSQGNGYLVAKQGNLQIDSVVSHQSEQSSQRVGTVFNILKMREQDFTHAITSNGSVVESKSNLYISTDKKLNVRGSEVVAEQFLDIAAISGVSVVGASNSVYHNHQSAGITLSAKRDPIKVDFDKKQAIKNVVKGIINKKTVNDIANSVKDQVTFSAGGSVTVGLYNHNQSTNSNTHKASTLSGGTETINSNIVNVAGSNISASAGDLTINANKITTNAQYDRQDTHSNNTDAGSTLAVKVNQSGVTGSASLGVNHKNTHTTTTTETATGSQLSATGDVNLTANRITHTGTSISASNHINEHAAHINHLAATNRTTSNETNVNVGITVQSGIDKSKVINGSVKLSAEGAKETSSAENASVTSLQAGKNITVNTNTLVDQGTQYQGGEEVSLNSKRHELDATRNSKQSDKVSGGASLTLSGNSKDLNTVNLNVSVGVKFQKESGAETQDQNATVSGKNVSINTGVLNSKAKISATENLSVNATQGANFNQVDHHQSQQGGGFNAEVGVGALVIPASNTAIPSVNASLGVNGHSSQSNQGTASSISANNVAISTPNLNLQGTNVTATSTHLNANNINIEAVHNERKNIDVATGVSVKVGAGTSSLDLSGNLDVKYENTVEHTGTTIDSKRLDINAGNVTVTGASTQSDELSVNANNVSLNAPTNSVNKTNVSVSGSIGGGIANGQWTPNSGSGAVSVEVARNLTHTTTALNAENAVVNSNTLSMNGSSVNAENLSGKVNTVHAHSTVDSVKEVGVAISASGSGKATRYTKDGWKEAVKKDWKGGSIAGVKAEVKFDLSVKRQQGNVIAGLQVRNNNLKVNRQYNSGNLAPVINKNIKVSGHINTNAKDMMKRAKQDLKNKQMPWIKVQH